MEKIPTNQFLAFCRELEGFELTTMARKTKFSVLVTDDGLEFLISKTGNRRIHKLSYVESVNRRFFELGEENSFHLGSYQDLTVNTSYQLSLISLYLNLKRILRD